ncbi:MAG: ATP-binding protein [Dolichospermum sp.]
MQVKLSVSRFLKRRTAILGQAGFGKSNLIKSVMSEIGYYGDDNTIIIFDIDGEYSFRTEQSVGLADIKNIRDRLVIFTLTERQEEEYKDVIAGKATLNLKDLSPQEVVNSLFPESKRGTNYAGWLLSIKQNEIETKWHTLIDEINEQGLDTDLARISEILGVGENAGVSSLFGLKTILNRIIFSQHDPNSSLLSDIDEAVNEKRIIIVDLSRMPLDSANGLIETILTRLFRKNEEKFVSGQNTIPMLIMIEEAQNFLSKKALQSESNIVVRIAKEGRKYGFGLIYITQQPSAIDETVLSQTNNFFILHLLTQGDIKALTSNNPVYESVAHYIQSEPLRGYAYFYSNVYSEDGKIQPTTVVFSSKIRKFDDVAKEIDEKESKHKWESFLKEKNKHREKFMEVVIDVIDDFYQADNHDNQSTIKWTTFWGTINNKLPKENPYKDGYTSANNYKYPDRNMINYAEKQLNGDNDFRYRLENKNKEIIIKLLKNKIN